MSNRSTTIAIVLIIFVTFFLVHLLINGSTPEDSILDNKTEEEVTTAASKTDNETGKATHLSLPETYITTVSEDIAPGKVALHNSDSTEEIPSPRKNSDIDSLLHEMNEKVQHINQQTRLSEITLDEAERAIDQIIEKTFSDPLFQKHTNEYELAINDDHSNEMNEPMQEHLHQMISLTQTADEEIKRLLEMSRKGEITPEVAASETEMIIEALQSDLTSYNQPIEEKSMADPLLQNDKISKIDLHTQNADAQIQALQEQVRLGELSAEQAMEETEKIIDGVQSAINDLQP